MDRISDLRTFVRLAETLSFSRTATAMGVARASVGRTVERLEADLDTRLVQRTTRSVALTPNGELLRERALDIIVRADELAAMFAESSGPRGVLRVSVPTRMGRRLFVPALPAFLIRHPEIELDLSTTDRPVDLVREGVDCAVRVGEQLVSGLVSRRIGMLRMVNVASPAYLAAHGTPHTLQDLRHHRAVGYVSPRDCRDHGWEWVENRRARTTRVPSSVRVNNAELYIAAALAGLGMIQVPAYDVTHLLSAGKLVEVLPNLPAEPMPVALVSPDRPSLVPTVAAFADWAEEVCKKSLV
jgi:DNA-binding transcriptional LysR family regulator